MGTRHLQFWPSVPRRLTVPKMSLWWNLAISARRFPDKPALIYYDSVITYAELHRAAEQLAGFLQHKGVTRGDRVGLYLQNSPQFIIGYYAILRADAMVVPINPMNLTDEVGHIVRDSGARVVIAAQDQLERITPLLGHGVDHLVVACYGDYLQPSTTAPALAVPAWISTPRQPVSADGTTAWTAALAAGVTPGPHLATPDDL